MYRYLLFVLLVLPAAQLNAADIITLYKQAYQQAVTDRISEQLTAEYRKLGVSDEQITKNIAHITGRMANCQVQMFENYEARYVETAYSVTANGGSLDQSNKAIEEQMSRDVASGAITEEQLGSMVANGINFVQACTAKIFNK